MDSSSSSSSSSGFSSRTPVDLTSSPIPSFKSCEDAFKYAEENDVDFKYNGNSIYGPTTRTILEAIVQFNEIAVVKIDKTVLDTLGEPTTDFTKRVIAMLKDTNSTTDDVRKLFDGKAIGQWISSAETKYTLLHFACRYNRESIVKLALEHDCCTKDINWRSHTAAYYAVNYGASRGVLDLLYKTLAGVSTLIDVLGTREMRNFHNDPTWTPKAVSIPKEFDNIVEKICDGVVTKKRKTEEEEEFECMICMDARPNTIVHPCGCCAVCKSCSLKLRETSDKERCVRCRQKIEWIDDDI